ncbi:hypothetical protein ACFY12_04610 [Streptomyces sp. NPDC001339]|uniref:hypothetical protein n=1 Tax=Streptomyces sp. NPDC001339 TaxID=3364563 RepID=UPI003688C01D
MSSGVWARLRGAVGEEWDRHVRFRDLHRLLDEYRHARVAWVDELTEADLVAMRCGLVERLQEECVRELGDVS